MKPIIKYRGGKSHEIPYIIKHIPSFTGRYVEPFFGGGAMFFYLEPQIAIINDINSKLMEFYSEVRNNYASLRKELDEVEHIYSNNRKEFESLKQLRPIDRIEDKNEIMYYELRDMFNGLVDKKYSDGLLYYYINKTSYSGMIRYNARGEFNVPFGRYANLNTKIVSEAHSRLLQCAEVFNMDYSEVFNMCSSNDFVFLDPPYDCIFSDYGNIEHKDGFSECNHRKLAQDFRNLPCKALMVVGRTPLTEELYGDCIIDEYEKHYAVNIRNRFKSTATHIVVTNYGHHKGEHDVPYAEYEYNRAEIGQLVLFETNQPYGKNR